MSDNIFRKIEMMETYATKQEKVIIDYIHNNTVKDLLLLSITELADRINVGEATILRFCKKLGLKGYSEFRFLLSQSSDEIDPAEENDSAQILHYMIEALQSTYDLLDSEQIKKAADLILKAKNVYAFGSGNSGIAALEFKNKVLRYGLNVTNFADAHFQLISTALLQPSDVLVLFSVSGQTKDVINLAKMADKQNVPLIVVTNYLKSPLAKYATALLYVVGKSAPLNSGSLVSKVSQLYIIDVLSKEILNQMGNTAKENLRRTALAVMDKEV